MLILSNGSLTETTWMPSGKCRRIIDSFSFVVSMIQDRMIQSLNNVLVMFASDDELNGSFGNSVLIAKRFFRLSICKSSPNFSHLIFGDSTLPVLFSSA